MHPEKVAALRIERRPLSGLKPHPRNPRAHPEPGTEEWEKLSASLADAYFDPLVRNERNGLLVSGHLRRKVLLASGFTAADVVVVEWDEQRHLARMIAANQSAGKDDKAELAVILEELSGAGFNLALTGLLDSSLAKLLPGEPMAEPEAPAAPIDGAPPQTRLGDLYLLGPHRLLCGDSSQPAAVHALMGGDVVDQVVTDPPYGVDYVEKTRAMCAAKGEGSGGPVHRPAHFVIEGSANLRSSDNLEQICVFDDPEAHDFHAGWIDELTARTPSATSPAHV